MKQYKSTAKIRNIEKSDNISVSYETDNEERSIKLHNKKIGILGEDYTCEYLESVGLSVFERNFAMKYGELDIVAVSYETIVNKDVVKKIYIIEVKTSVLYDNIKINAIENATFKKLQKVARLGEFYVKEKFPTDVPFSICVCAVYLNKDFSLNKIDFIRDIEI